MQVVFITHPEVSVRPDVPVPQWELSPAGHARLERLVTEPWVAGLTAVVSSAERKALQTAQRLGGAAGAPVTVDDELGENDRSATGYLPPAEFEAVADQFFARPHESVRGWERAVDAQRRITVAVERAVAGAAGAAGDLAVVAHGGVGALLLCALLGVPVDRRYDQPGQGSFFRFDPATARVVHPWRRLPA